MAGPATGTLVAACALEEVTDAARKTLPSRSLIITRDYLLSPAASRFMARRAHAHTAEVEASHTVPVFQHGAAGTIEQAAHATTR
ncbi:hypothetical protein ABZ904_36070 [Streptomyces sp. NPDC046900]|uniref:hypothetical protein n=1 Tax=Streptomyces sp. NPDC046900 TaxID=3155473 RepID=UPI00340EB711